MRRGPVALRPRLVPRVIPVGREPPRRVSPERPRRRALGGRARPVQAARAERPAVPRARPAVAAAGVDGNEHLRGDGRLLGGRFPLMPLQLPLNYCHECLAVAARHRCGGDIVSNDRVCGTTRRGVRTPRNMRALRELRRALPLGRFGAMRNGFVASGTSKEAHGSSVGAKRSTALCDLWWPRRPGASTSRL